MGLISFLTGFYRCLECKRYFYNSLTWKHYGVYLSLILVIVFPYTKIFDRSNFVAHAIFLFGVLVYANFYTSYFGKLVSKDFFWTEMFQICNCPQCGVSLSRTKIGIFSFSKKCKSCNAIVKIKSKPLFQVAFSSLTLFLTILTTTFLLEAKWKFFLFSFGCLLFIIYFWWKKSSLTFKRT